MAEMDQTELREILDLLGWSQQMLAEFAGRDTARTRKQARGRHPIDAPLAEWLRAIATLIRNPPAKPARYLSIEPEVED
jgi:hypothetical protein